MTKIKKLLGDWRMELINLEGMEKYGALMEFLDICEDGLVLLDKDLKVTYMNSYAKEIFSSINYNKKKSFIKEVFEFMDIEENKEILHEVKGKW